MGAEAVKQGLNKMQAKLMVEAMANEDWQAYAPKVPGVTPTILKACLLARQYAYANALQLVWYTTIPFGVIGCLLCLGLPNIKKYMTNKVAVVSIVLAFPSVIDSNGCAQDIH